MDNFDETIKIESTSSDTVIEFNVDDEEHEMQIIQAESMYNPMQSSSRKKTYKSHNIGKYGRTRVEILPNDDPRVVRAGKRSLEFYILGGFKAARVFRRYLNL